MLTDDEFALLLAVRDAGSLSRAAARLGKAPSTVSHAARVLEERFDALLFDRRRYRLELTPAGALLAREYARHAVELEQLASRIKQLANGWEERLCIVTDELLEFATLLPVIRQFDELKSGVMLRVTHEVLSGTWEALQDGRAQIIVGATNEPPSIPKLRWHAMGTLQWVFAVAPRHPLARRPEPLSASTLAEYRSVVVADTSRGIQARSYGIAGRRSQLAVPSMRAKILAQVEGLGVGWLPRTRVATLLAKGRLIEKQVEDPREPNTLYLAWRGDQEGRALRWWVEQLRLPRLAKRLLDGLDVATVEV